MRFIAATRILLSIVVLPVCAVALPMPVGGATAEGCGESPERLRAGHLAITEQAPSSGRGVALRVCGTVDAPPAAVWDVLRDCDQFARFLPGVRRSRLTQRQDNVVLCDETIDMPFPLADLRSLTRVVESTLEDGGYQRRWSLVRGSYRQLAGAWIIHPADPTAVRSLVVYEVDMEPDTAIPEFMIRHAQAFAAARVFAAVRERVRQCVAPPGCGEE